MAERGRLFVSTRFQQDRMVDETGAWLLELLRHARQPAAVADVREA